MKHSTIRPVLIVLSETDGHRQNYAAVLGRWFADRGHKVVVACGPTEKEALGSQSPVLAHFIATTGLAVIDLAREIVQDPARFRATLTQLEVNLNPTWTLLANGDECLRALQGEWQVGANACRRAAILIYFPNEYPLDLRALSYFKRFRPWARHLLDRYRKRRIIKNDSMARLGLDLVLTTDENVASALDHPNVRFLPEIYKAWGADISTETGETEEARLNYARFRARNSGKEVLLYYGGRYKRRGYDTLMALALENQETVFVSVGRNDPMESFEASVGSSRQQLFAQGRLFELDIPFLPENALVDDLFRSAKYVILPYRDWYGLSGSLYQAASYGCPVIVPDIGSMGSTVRRYGIGLTYRHLDMKSLQRRFLEIRNDFQIYRDNVQQFSRRFDYSSVSSSMIDIFS